LFAHLALMNSFGYSAPMRSAPECLAKATEMDERAARCDGPLHSAEYIEMASCWRMLSRMAAYQDRWAVLLNWISPGPGERAAPLPREAN
jgi:hypothetical protein